MVGGANSKGGGVMPQVMGDLDTKFGSILPTGLAGMLSDEKKDLQSETLPSISLKMRVKKVTQCPSLPGLGRIVR